MTDDINQADWKRWSIRQEEMEQWYDELISTPTQAKTCFASDYSSYADILRTFSGTVLDVGGGAGVVRSYLPANVEYFLLEPSAEWLKPQWIKFVDHKQYSKFIPVYIRGVGEKLPFRSHIFDAALSFWSMNHAIQPALVFGEISRVLKTGGRFLLILEEMEPTWLDVVYFNYAKKVGSSSYRIFTRKLLCALGARTWPIQADHIRIRENEMNKWISGRFEILQRFWVGDYLTFELRSI